MVVTSTVSKLLFSRLASRGLRHFSGVSPWQQRTVVGFPTSPTYLMKRTFTGKNERIQPKALQDHLDHFKQTNQVVPDDNASIRRLETTT